MKNMENNKYRVVFSKTCQREIKTICEYIETKLYAKQASKRLIEKMYKLISNLERYPLMYPKVSNFKNVKLKYRKITVDNYIILYTIRENIVYISHMYYGKSNYLSKKDIEF